MPGGATAGSRGSGGGSGMDGKGVQQRIVRRFRPLPPSPWGSGNRMLMGPLGPRPGGPGSQMSADRIELFNTLASQRALRGYLEDLGYRIFERLDGWSECLLVGHGESWLGRGGTPIEAFEAAWRSGFPSVAARTALVTAIQNHRISKQESEREAQQGPLHDNHVPKRRESPPLIQ